MNQVRNIVNMNEIRSIVSVYQIDVNWDATRAYGRIPVGGNCPGCSVPLNNVVGAFAQDPFAAAGFSLHLLTFFAAAALSAYSFVFARRLEHRTFFGLRVALVLFVVSRFFAWVYAAVPNSRPVTRSYIIFSLIPLFFQYASDIAVFWTLTRTVLQPLVVATRYSRAKSVGLGLTISWGLVATANWALFCWGTSREINSDWSEIVWFGSGDLSTGTGLVDLIYAPLGGLWGVVLLALSIKALRSARAHLDAPYHVVPKLTIAASVIWIVRIAMVAVSSWNVVDEQTGPAHTYSSTPLLMAVFVDLFGLGLFATLFLCYRPQLALLYAADSGYVKSGTGNGNAQQPEEGRASSVVAHELQNMDA